MTATIIPHLLPHGAYINIVLHLRNILLQGMVIQGVMTKLWHQCIDDTLLWLDTIHNCFFQAAQWLDICGRNGIILNPENLYAHDVVEFEITCDTVRPCKRYLRAITEFPILQMSDLGLVCSIKCHMPSAWLNGCFHLEIYSNQLYHFIGMTHLISCLRNPKLWLLLKLLTEWKSLIRLSQLVLQQIGLEMA